MRYFKNTMPKIKFLPFQVEVEVAENETIFDAILKNNLYIRASCGGTGSCNKCKVLLRSGEVKGDLINNKYYKACTSYPLTDVEVEIPFISESNLEFFKRTRKKAGFIDIFSKFFSKSDKTPNPLFTEINLKLSYPTLEDNRDDLQRLLEGLKKKEVLGPEVSLAVLRKLPLILRKASFDVYVEIFEDPRNKKFYLLEVKENKNEENLGVAIDLGTTTVQLELIDLQTGKILCSVSDYNPQMVYGEDVITRIEFTKKKEGLKILSQIVKDKIFEMIKEALQKSNKNINHIRLISLSGNTVMVHLFLELEPRFLREFPYVPVAIDFPIFKASEIGWDFSKNTLVQIMPCKASYVGGDVVAGVTVSQIHKEEPITVFIDLGTNGEIVVGNKDFLICAACSAGPAFEGGGIKHGTRYTLGAIEHVSIDPYTLEPMITTVGKSKPIGICGSGIISLVANLFLTGIIDRSGKINRDLEHPRIREGPDGWEYVVVFKEEAGLEEDIVFTEADVKNVIRAKGAIFSGCKLLLESIGLSLSDIERVYLAGNFGTYIDLESAIMIGLLPDIPREKFYFLGNTSLIGARTALLFKEVYKEMSKVSKMMTYVELSEHPNYMEYYISSNFLPHTDEELFPSIKKLIRSERNDT